MKKITFLALVGSFLGVAAPAFAGGGARPPVAIVERELGVDVLSITPVGEVQVIRIQTLADPTVTVTETANTLTIKAVAYARTQKEAADLFLGQADAFEKGELTLGVKKSGLYYCSMEKRNGVVRKLKGACLDSVAVTIPVGSQIQVYLNDKVVK